MNALRIGLILAALVAGALAVHLWEGSGRRGSLPVPPAARSDFSATVVQVIDGDTLRLSGGLRVRLIGVDAPERGHPLYTAAREGCRSLAGGRTVRLTIGEDRPVDDYGRTLALVHAGDLLINEELLARGLARAYFRSEKDLPAEMARRLVRAQCRAIDGRLGLWGLPGALATASGERLVETRFRFHRAGCPALAESREGRALPPSHNTREAALRSGKSPCRTCNPRRRRYWNCNRARRRSR